MLLRFLLDASRHVCTLMKRQRANGPYIDGLHSKLTLVVRSTTRHELLQPAIGRWQAAPTLHNNNTTFGLDVYAMKLSQPSSSKAAYELACES